MITDKSIKPAIGVVPAPGKTESVSASAVPPPKAAHVHADPPIGLRTVAMFEFGKGILFLLFGLGALSFVHSDVAVAADNILKHLHLDPAWHLSKFVVRKISTYTPSQIWWFGIVALFLAAVRVVEGYCLWHERSWAEWFAVISSGCYLPYELYLFYRRLEPAIAVVFLVNLAIVVYLGFLLVEKYRNRALNKSSPKP